MIGENIIKNEIEYMILKEATAISANILRRIKEETKIGISAASLDKLAGQLCLENNVKPSFKGVRGVKGPYSNNICISTNDEILHAIPKEERIFKSGDIVKLDFGIIHKGFFTDHCVTVGLGELTPEEKKLIHTGEQCIETAIKQAIKGNTVGDISNALQTVAEEAGFNYVTTYVGHGIGRSLHLSPEIPAYGQRGAGIRLQNGMVLCIENQITLGSADLKMDNDGWTLSTKDGSKGVMFEHMVLIKDNAPQVLTRL
jgi:methionyl aminopeptidase